MKKDNLSLHLLNLAEATLNQLFNTAAKALISQHKIKHVDVLQLPNINLRQRGTIAGSAHLSRNLIKLNSTLFSQNRDYFIEQVIPHELAHILVYQMHWPKRVRPHGKEWKFIMQEVFHKQALVKHSLDVSSVGMRQVAYHCSCSRVMLSIIRHNKVVKGKQTYVCKECHQTLIEC